MYKIVRMLKRRKDLSLAEFKQYWLERHAQIVRRCLQTGPVLKAVASFSTGEVALGGKEAQFDGMSALYFATLEQARAALSGSATAALRADESNFADTGRAPPQIVADEHRMSEKPGAAQAIRISGQLKIVRTVYRRRDLSHAQFKEYWLNNHVKLEHRVIAESPMQRIVATFAVPEHGSEPDIDGMVELYFGSLEDIRATMSGPVPAMMRRDEENFVQMDAPAIRAVAEEYLIGEKT